MKKLLTVGLLGLLLFSFSRCNNSGTGSTGSDSSSIQRSDTAAMSDTSGRTDSSSRYDTSSH